MAAFSDVASSILGKVHEFSTGTCCLYQQGHEKAHDLPRHNPEYTKDSHLHPNTVRT
jgi:hypothetical protein